VISLRGLWSVGAVALGLAVAGAALADDGAEYAGRLAALRTEVARLADEIEAEQEAQRGELRSIEAQKTELAAQIRREEIRLRALRETVEERRALITGGAASAVALVPVVRATLEDLEEAVDQGLPYRVQERREGLAGLRSQLDEGVIRPQVAAHRTWQFVEDELRLSRENALDRQVISLGGEEMLAEVARVGMIALYFRTDDGEVGRAVHTASGWQWQAWTDPVSVDRVEVLFDALTKQIRTGWFELPEVLSGDRS
jgi:hypothetical protein